MQMLHEATLFATRKHKGQARKGTGAPYVTHPVAVSIIVAAYKRSKRLEELLVAAVLHDVMEDTPTTFAELARRFSPFVAALVLELTNDPIAIAALGKLEYQTRKMIGMSSYALVIKLADRLHNISDNPSTQMVADTLTLIQRLRKARKLSKTQTRLANEIVRRCHERQANNDMGRLAA